LIPLRPAQIKAINGIGVNAIRVPRPKSTAHASADTTESPIFRLRYTKLGVDAQAQQTDGEFTMLAGSLVVASWHGIGKADSNKLARAQQLQKAHHKQFVRFFGADFIVIPGAQLTERMRSFYTFCRDQAVAEFVEPGEQPKDLRFHHSDYPADLVASDLVAVTHDEVEGMGVYAEFGMIEEAFDDPSVLHYPDYRRRVRDYLDDPTVSPLLFERMAARDPERTNQVFRKLLGRKHFDWAIDGERLMRRRKSHHFEQTHLPRIVPIGDRLRPYAAGA
jgi:hypothetical protein